MSYYKKIFCKINVAGIIKNRKKDRPAFLKDETDPYFLLRKNWENIDFEFEDKFLLKEKIKDIVNLKSSKTFFTFNKKGEITSGSIPNKKKVMIKTNLGYASRGNFIAKVSDINKKFLKSCFKKLSKGFDKDNGIWNNMYYYSKMEPVYYAEEILPDPTDYKIIVFENDVRYTFIKNVDKPEFPKEQRVFSDFDSKFNAIPRIINNYKADYYKFSKEEKQFFEKAKIIARKVYKKMGRVVRVDFYNVNGEPYIGEMAYLPHFGYWYYGKTQAKYPVPTKQFLKETTKLLKDSIK